MSIEFKCRNFFQIWHTRKPLQGCIDFFLLEKFSQPDEPEETAASLRGLVSAGAMGAYAPTETF